MTNGITRLLDEEIQRICEKQNLRLFFEKRIPNRNDVRAVSLESKLITYRYNRATHTYLIWQDKQGNIRSRKIIWPGWPRNCYETLDDFYESPKEIVIEATAKFRGYRQINYIAYSKEGLGL